jgi:hypothetical protein
MRGIPVYAGGRRIGRRASLRTRRSLPLITGKIYRSPSRRLPRHPARERVSCARRASMSRKMNNRPGGHRANDARWQESSGRARRTDREAAGS